jgi:hypothetical protein
MVVTISQEGMVFFNDERTTVKGLAGAFQQRRTMLLILRW